ncbi:MAG: hypothetical protein F6J90_34165 [Moorea sp. SIOASIH]|uniref:hypothetical protein n=1 Tax=Moorena sp. SIOASIH TaxID=2607817 RepID=UPI0013B6DF6A|nr:hypothetical protein [Moorena sp. SIOASIH]NEO41097.1 hypothetical protein [Moorena sp. SIOASIH]
MAIASSNLLYFNYEISAMTLSQFNKFPENQGFFSEIGSGLRTFMMAHSEASNPSPHCALGDTPWLSNQLALAG